MESGEVVSERSPKSDIAPALARTVPRLSRVEALTSRQRHRDHHAAMRADAMLEAGDLDGYAVWKRIVKAVEGLLSKERTAGVTVQ